MREATPKVAKPQLLVGHLGHFDRTPTEAKARDHHRTTCCQGGGSPQRSIRTTDPVHWSLLPTSALARMRAYCCLGLLHGLTRRGETHREPQRTQRDAPRSQGNAFLGVPRGVLWVPKGSWGFLGGFLQVFRRFYIRKHSQHLPTFYKNRFKFDPNLIQIFQMVPNGSKGCSVFDDSGPCSV